MGVGWKSTFWVSEQLRKTVWDTGGLKVGLGILEAWSQGAGGPFHYHSVCDINGPERVRVSPLTYLRLRCEINVDHEMQTIYEAT